MAVQAFVSPLNLTEHTTLSMAVTSEHGTFTGQQARFPEQPFMPWRTTTTAGTQDLFMDFGATFPVDCVLIVNTNYTTVTAQLDTDSAFSPAAWSVALTAARNPWTGRYTASALITPAVSVRYARIRISGATVDGATVFSTGGVWWGAYGQSVPRDIRWQEQMLTLEPVHDTPLPWGAIHRRRIGQPYTRMVAKRPALLSRTTPGVGDELSTWLDIDREAEFYGSLAWFANRGNPAEAWVMRRINEPAWPIHHVLSEDSLTLEEWVGP